MYLDQSALHASALEGAVRGCGLDCKAVATERAGAAHLAELRLKGVSIRQTKVRMVENIEEASTQLELHTLGNREDFVDVKVRVKVAETTEAVPGISVAGLADAAGEIRTVERS